MNRPLLYAFAVLCAALAARRVALVIGNAAYRHGPLANTVGDAATIAQLFRDAHFDVVDFRRDLGSWISSARSASSPT